MKIFFTWRLKLILFVGTLLGIGLGIFSYHVARMSDVPYVSKPFTVAFSVNSQNVPEFFRVDNESAIGKIGEEVLVPAIDRKSPEKTETALFALG